MYKFPVELARTHLPELMAKIVKVASTEHVAYYSEVSPDEIGARLTYVFNMYLKYLETDDLTEWRTFCAAIISQRVNQGYDYTKIIAMNKMMLGVLEDFFRTNLPSYGTVDGKPAERVVRGLAERLNGLHSVGLLTATATAMKVQREKNNLP